jgi:hypothetical protein
VVRGLGLEQYQVAPPRIQFAENAILRWVSGLCFLRWCQYIGVPSTGGVLSKAKGQESNEEDIDIHHAMQDPDNLDAAADRNIENQILADRETL